MPRTVEPILTAALAHGIGTPYLKGYLGYTDGTVLHSGAVTAYKLTGSTLEFEMAYSADITGDQDALWLERGLTIAGANYTVTTGRFCLLSQRYLPNGHQIASGALFPKQYYSAAGDVSYKTAIDAFCANFGKTAVYRDPAAAWLNYQFFPAGKSIILNDANAFANLLAQKYLLFLCDNGSEQVLVYSSAFHAADHTLTPTNDFYRELSLRSARLLLWRDELATIHTAGAATDPIHNLGYLESTASAPSLHSMPSLFAMTTRPDLRILDGDIVTIAQGAGNSSGLALVTEQYEAGEHRASAAHFGSKGSRSHTGWTTTVESNQIFGNTAGGALPSTIERVSNYTPLNTSLFNHILSASDNNLQAAMNTLDDHSHGSGTYSNVWGSNGMKAALAANATNYVCPFMDGLQTDSGIAVNFPKNATVKNLYVRIATAQPAGGTLVVTVMIGGVASAIVLTIPAGSAAGVYSNTIDTAALTAGQAVTFRFKNNAPAAVSAQINGITVEFAGLT